MPVDYNIKNAEFISIISFNQSALNLIVSSAVILKNCLFLNCSGVYLSGGVCCQTQEHLSIHQSSFILCSGETNFAVRCTGDFQLFDSIFDKNQKNNDSEERQGSALHVPLANTIHLETNNFTNTIAYHRACFFLCYGEQTVSFLSAYNNTSESNGVILQFGYDNKETHLISSLIYGNKCPLKFALIRILQRTMIIKNTIVFENESPGSFYGDPGDTFMVDNSYFDDSSIIAATVTFNEMLSSISSIFIQPHGYNNQNNKETWFLTKYCTSKCMIFIFWLCNSFK